MSADGDFIREVEHIAAATIGNLQDLLARTDNGEGEFVTDEIATALRGAVNDLEECERIRNQALWG